MIPTDISSSRASRLGPGSANAMTAAQMKKQRKPVNVYL
jgi:hypothetical protein